MSSSQTEQVLGHHLQSFGEGNVEAVMEDYTEDSVVITPDGALNGLAEIRPLFEHLLNNVLPPGSTEFEMKQQVIQGEIAYILWAASSGTHNIPLGTDTFVVRDGKIVAQTFAGQIDEKS